MSHSTQFVGSQNVWQEWYELTTGLHGRLMGVDLIGLTTSTGLQQITVTSGGSIHAELQPSTESIGILGASTSVIGHVIADASSAKIGALQPSTEIIGYVKIDQTTPGVSNAVTVTSTGGTTLFSTGSPGMIQAMASTQKIGALQPSTETIGYVNVLSGGTAPGLGSNNFFGVQLYGSGASVGTDARNNSIGQLVDHSGNPMSLTSRPELCNGVTYDRARNNLSATLLASTSRTSDAASADQTNYNARAHLIQIVYATSSGAGITPSVQVKDSVSGSYAAIWTAAVAITSTGHYTYLIDSAASTASAGPTEVAGVRPGRTWRLNVAHSSSGATTYSASIDDLL